MIAAVGKCVSGIAVAGFAAARDGGGEGFGTGFLMPDSRPLFPDKDQADRAISTGKLHALLRFHTRPIDVVVFHGS